MDDPDLSSEDLRADAGINSLRGVGASEAPRGTLFHDYTVDRNGLLQKVNLIVATGQNNLAMNQTVAQIARHYVRGDDIPEPMLNRVEHGIRCYDPCLSCSTHAVGQMPLHVQLIGPGWRRPATKPCAALPFRHPSSGAMISSSSATATSCGRRWRRPARGRVVAAMNLPGVRALACPLLAPELADPISKAPRSLRGRRRGCAAQSPFAQTQTGPVRANPVARRRPGDAAGAGPRRFRPRAPSLVADDPRRKIRFRRRILP